MKITMTKSEQIRKMLAPLNLYSLNGKSLVEKEIRSYCVGLDSLQSKLNSLQRSLWVTDGDEKTLEMWERRLGYTGTGTLQDRREEILRILRLNMPCTFELGSIGTYLRRRGFEGYVTDDYVRAAFILTTWEPVNSIEEYAPFVYIARRVVPAHLIVTVDLPQENWNQTDARNYTFDRWDAMKLNWEINN